MFSTVRGEISRGPERMVDSCHDVATEAPAGRHRMNGHDASVNTAENYRRFAQYEAAGRSPEYEALALAVAADSTLLDYLSALPQPKRQPNLLFAAARYLLDDIPDPDRLRELVTRRPDQLRKVILTKRTQTNEVARCATLLPALCRLPQPLALIEVGASAGLALLLDRYSYDYEGQLLKGSDPAAPTLPCRVEGPVPLPAAAPKVLWRHGLDLNPLDPHSATDMHWLECLIWPGELGRMERLHAAAAVGRREPPSVQRGDLVDDLTDVVAKAPSEAATIVVFHSAVLAYVEAKKRADFARLMTQLGVHWLSNEAPGVLPVTAPTKNDGFLLIENGDRVLAETDPHGTWLRWHEQFS